MPLAILLSIAFAEDAYAQEDRWIPVPPGGTDSSPDYSWEKHSSTRCLRPTDKGYGSRLEALGELLFGTASTMTSGCVTGVYLENGYSSKIPEMTNHAGIDFRANGQPVYSPVSGKVSYELLDAAEGKSTLTIETNDKTYNILLLHCSSHQHRRNGLPVPALKEGIAVQKGDQVCIAGSLGADAAHLHIEVKRAGQDAGRLKAMFGGAGACRKSPCTLVDVRANTVDPTVLVSSTRSISGDGSSKVPPTSAPVGYAAAVRDDQAQFTFPLKPQRAWELCDGGNAGMPYSWNVRVANGGNRYEFGFSMFSTQGAGSCHRGNFEQLLAHGQFGAWKITRDGDSVIQDAQVKYAISDAEKLLHVVLNDRKTINLLFSDKPMTVTFESVFDWNKTTVNIPVVYVAPLASSSPTSQSSHAVPSPESRRRNTDPTFLYSPAAPYPEEERKRHIQGVAVLVISIDAKGNITDVLMEKSSGSRNLDLEAVKTARTWRASPEIRNGQPVASRVRVPMTFSLF